MAFVNVWSTVALCIVLSLSEYAECTTHFDTSSPLDNAIRYVCTGNTISFPWTLSLDKQDDIEDIQWFYHGQSDEMVAMFATGNFLALPAFSHRVRFISKAGMALSNARASDKGEYSVRVTGRNSQGAFFSLSRSIRLVVSDSLLTSRDLEVRQSPRAEWSELTQEWRAELTCGFFIYPDHDPPFDVIWTDPAGIQFSSSFYDSGSFHLLLNNSVTSGNFTCRVPTHLSRCTQPGGVGSHGGNPGAGAAAVVTVDAMAARVAVLEAVQGDLVGEIVRLKKNASGTLEENLQLKGMVEGFQNAQRQLIQQTTDLRQQTDDLRALYTNSSALTELAQRTQLLEDTLNNQHGARLSQLNQLETQLAELNRTVVQCSDKSGQLAQQNQALTQQNAQLTQQIERLKQQEAATAARCQSVGRMFNASSSSLTSAITSLEQRFTRLGEVFVNTSSQVRNVESGLASAYQDNSALDQRVTGLQAEVTSASRNRSSLWGRVAVMMEGVDRANRGLVAMGDRLQDVDRLVGNLASVSSAADVSFHVRMASADNTKPGHEQALVLSEVISNRGRAYSATSGRFTAPRNATYLLLATVSAPTRDAFCAAHLMVGEDVEVGYVESYTGSHYQASTLHAVLSLAAGQVVWLRNNGAAGRYNNEVTAFSGAMLLPHP